MLFSCIALGGGAYQVLNKGAGTFPLILCALSTIAAAKKWYDVYHTSNTPQQNRRYRRLQQTNSPNPIELALKLNELRRNRK